MVAPYEGDGSRFIKRLRSLFLKYSKKGFRFIIIVGGGSTCRIYQNWLRKCGVTDDFSVDSIGIKSTHLNAHFVARALGKLAHDEIITTPKKITRFLRPVVIAGGSKPGSSTDLGAVKLAQKNNAHMVVNLSNIDYVYTADPRKNKNAKRLVALNWKQMQKIVGTKWSPGLNSPFDPIATKFAGKHDIDVAMIGGDKLGELEKLLDGKEFAGTWVSNSVVGG